MARFSSCYPTAARLLAAAGLDDWRQELTAGVRGDVLEIGAGSGQQAPWYEPGARVTAVEPDEALRARVPTGAYAAVVDAVAEDLPFADASFDWVVAALVLCSVDDLDASLAECRRVLRPGGAIRALEHVVADHALLRTAQHAARRPWRRIASGCTLDRDTIGAMRRAGLRVAVRRSKFAHALVLLEAHVAEPVT